MRKGLTSSLAFAIGVILFTGAMELYMALKAGVSLEQKLQPHQLMGVAWFGIIALPGAYGGFWLAGFRGSWISAMLLGVLLGLLNVLAIAGISALRMGQPAVIMFALWVLFGTAFAAWAGGRLVDRGFRMSGGGPQAAR